MHRPAPADLDVHFGQAVAGAAGRWPAGRAPQAPARRGDFDGRGRALCRASSRGRREGADSPPARRAAERGLTEIARRARAGRLLARAAPGSGSPSSSPARREPPRRDRPLRGLLFMNGGGGEAADRRLGRRGSPRAADGPAGRRPIVAINGARVDAERDPAHLDSEGDRSRSSSSAGRRPSCSARCGPRRRTALPARLRRAASGRRPGDRAGSRCAYRARDEGDRRLARRLVHRRGREEISSPVGIVQGSSERSTQGGDLPLGARPDQPLARAAQPAAAPAARRRPHRLLDHRGRPRAPWPARSTSASRRSGSPSCCCSSSASRTTSAGSAACDHEAGAAKPNGSRWRSQIRSADRRRRARRRPVDDADADARRRGDDRADRRARLGRLRGRPLRGAEDRGRRGAAADRPALADPGDRGHPLQREPRAEGDRRRRRRRPDQPGQHRRPRQGRARSCAAAKRAGIPMRIGANSGSLPKHLYELAQKDQAEALVAAALEEVELLERSTTATSRSRSSRRTSRR